MRQSGRIPRQVFDDAFGTDPTHGVEAFKVKFTFLWLVKIQEKIEKNYRV